ncbi:hypothetical protein AMTRI_Chr03g146280 [Amborella trichopoda]
MHDMMRELALWITSPESMRSPKLLVRVRSSLREAPEAAEWQEEQRISLMGHIQALPELPVGCPKLATLLLQYNAFRTIPPTNFFECMDRLSILDVSYRRVAYLPLSMPCLVNLCVLRLIACSLRELPELEHAKTAPFIGHDWLSRTGT